MENCVRFLNYFNRNYCGGCAQQYSFRCSCVCFFRLSYIYHYVIAYREYKAQKKELSHAFDRGDISISLERLSHISEETIYEPHMEHRYAYKPGMRDTKEVKFYYFSAGRSWRVPSTDCHYKWSKDYYLTTMGLLNISVEGNEFSTFLCRGISRFLIFILASFSLSARS